jgi:sirohydrochlorin ferrochelatase
VPLFLKAGIHCKVFVLQAELEQERHQHEETLAAMKEEEKVKVDKMAHDLEIKWTENLRYTFYTVM